MTYVCTEKTTISEWLKEIEQLKKDKELLLSDYKWLLEDKRELEKENRELRKQNKEIMDSYIMSEKAADARIEQLQKDMKYYIKFYDEHDWPIDRWAYDNDKN